MINYKVNGSVISEIHLIKYKELVTDGNLPVQHGAPGGLMRNCVKVINNYLINNELSTPTRGNRRGRLKEGVDLDDVFGAFEKEKELESKPELEPEPEYYSLSETKRATVYFIRALNGMVKIGTSMDFDKRFRALECASPVELHPEYIFEVDADKAFEVEGFFHRMFKAKHSHGEWHKLTNGDMEYVRVWDKRRKGEYIDPDLLQSEKRNKSKRIIQNLLVVSAIIISHWLVFIGIMSVLPESY